MQTNQETSALKKNKTKNNRVCPMFLQKLAKPDETLEAVPLQVSV